MSLLVLNILSQFELMFAKCFVQTHSSQEKKPSSLWFRLDSILLAGHLILSENLDNISAQIVLVTLLHMNLGRNDFQQELVLRLNMIESLHFKHFLEF